MASSNLKVIFFLSLEMKKSSGEVACSGTIFRPAFTQICPLGSEIIKGTGKHTDTRPTSYQQGTFRCKGSMLKTMKQVYVFRTAR